MTTMYWTWTSSVFLWAVMWFKRVIEAYLTSALLQQTATSNFIQEIKTVSGNNKIERKERKEEKKQNKELVLNPRNKVFFGSGWVENMPLILPSVKLWFRLHKAPIFSRTNKGLQVSVYSVCLISVSDLLFGIMRGADTNNSNYVHKKIGTAPKSWFDWTQEPLKYLQLEFVSL